MTPTFWALCGVFYTLVGVRVWFVLMRASKKKDRAAAIYLGIVWPITAILLGFLFILVGED